MGKSGTDVVKNVADMILTDDNFATIVVAVEEGRKVYRNIQKALQFLISTNCVEVFGMLIALMFCNTEVEKVKPPTNARTIDAKIPNIVIYSFSIFLEFLTKILNLELV